MFKLRCKNKNKLWSIMGYSLMMGNSIAIYVTFLYACLNNGIVTISINSFNEGVIEFFFIPTTIAIGLIGLIKLMWRN